MSGIAQKRLQDMSGADIETLNTLIEEVFEFCIPQPIDQYITPTFNMPKTQSRCENMRPSIGNLIMSTLDLLYGSGDDGTGFYWRRWFETEYGYENVEHVSRLKAYNPRTETADSLKYEGFEGGWSCDRYRGMFRGEETIEAIELRAKAIEGILGKYTDFVAQKFRDRLDGCLDGTAIQLSPNGLVVSQKEYQTLQAAMA